MSGLGPAACWLAHKRIESWSRMAKERVGAVRRVTLDRNSADESSGSGSGSGSGGSNGCAAQVLPGSEGAASTTPPLPQQMTPPPSASSVTSTTSGIGSVSAGSVSDSCDLPTDSEVLSQISSDQDSLKTLMLIPDLFVLQQEVNVAKESQHIQPASQMHGMPCIPNHPITTDVMRGPGEGYHSPLHLHHQSRSFPPRLQRTPSISSQSSVDSAPSRQSVG